MKITRLFALFLSVVCTVSPLRAQESAAIYATGFEEDTGLPKGWTGSVKVDESTGFKGNRSIVLEKTQETLRQEVKAMSPAFPLSPGMQQIRFATRTEMESMDNSYKGVLGIEFLDASGKVLENKPLAEPYRKSSW